MCTKAGKWVHHIYIICTKTYFSLIKVQYIIAFKYVCMYINIYMCIHSPICMCNVPTYLCTNVHTASTTRRIQCTYRHCLPPACNSHHAKQARAVSVVGAVREGR